MPKLHSIDQNNDRRKTLIFNFMLYYIQGYVNLFFYLILNFGLTKNINYNF
jgi:hypothetical protein